MNTAPLDNGGLWNLVSLPVAFAPAFGYYRLDVFHGPVQIRNFAAIRDRNTHLSEKAFQPIGASRREHSEYAARTLPGICERVDHVWRYTNERAGSARNRVVPIANPEVELSFKDVKHFGLRMMMPLYIRPWRKLCLDEGELTIRL